MNLQEIIKEKQNNIGSLCLYLNKRMNLIKELDDFIEKKLIDISKLTLAQKIYIYINNEFDINCDCGKLKKWKSFKYGWTKTCGGKECIKKSTIKTNIKIYGTDNPMKNEEILKKSQQKIFEIYGVTSAMKNEEIKEKFKTKLNNKSIEEKKETIRKRNETWLNKDIEEKNNIKNKIINTNLNKSNEEKIEIIKKRKNTCLEKYNNEYAISSLIIRDKLLNIYNEKFGGNSPFSDKNVKNKALISYRNQHIEYIKNSIIKFQCEYISHRDKNNSNIEYTLLCKRKNKEFTIGYSNLRNRILGNLEISPFFRPIYGKSEMEKNLFEFIKNNYSNIILVNKKNIIPELELDIYIPELKLAFEFNGLWWHNELNKENSYHLNKTELCEAQGIQLIHVWEDDWLYKQCIVKSMILNKLGKSDKIFARKTEIKEITDNIIVREFLIKNHIQGFVGSKVKIGLFFDNELVSLMTFGNRRVAMGKKSTNEGEYELLRFCNKLNTNVIGGASKLLKYFINAYKPKEITTYADRSISQGKLYETLGFNFVSKTEPNYYYIIDGIRHHRFNFRKDKLVKEGYDTNKTEHQIMLERKIYRIYDSGNLKFIYT